MLVIKGKQLIGAIRWSERKVLLNIQFAETFAVKRSICHLLPAVLCLVIPENVR